MTQSLLSKVIELSKVDSSLARIAAEKKKYETEKAVRKDALSRLKKEFLTREKIIHDKKSSYAGEEKFLREERDKIAERRRGLGTHNNYKLQQAAEKELEFLARQVNLKEDTLIKMLSEIEELEKDLEQWITKATAAKNAYDACQKEITENLPSLEERFQRFSTQRQEIIHGMNPADLTLYDRTRSRFPMDPVLPLNAQQCCSGCFMNIGPQIVVQIHRAETLVRCPGCNRILYIGADEAAATA